MYEVVGIVGGGMCVIYVGGCYELLLVEWLQLGVVCCCVYGLCFGGGYVCVGLCDFFYLWFVFEFFQCLFGVLCLCLQCGYLCGCVGGF